MFNSFATLFFSFILAVLFSQGAIAKRYCVKLGGDGYKKNPYCLKFGSEDLFFLSQYESKDGKPVYFKMKKTAYGFKRNGNYVIGQDGKPSARYKGSVKWVSKNKTKKNLAAARSLGATASISETEFITQDLKPGLDEKKAKHIVAGDGCNGLRDFLLGLKENKDRDPESYKMAEKSKLFNPLGSVSLTDAIASNNQGGIFISKACLEQGKCGGHCGKRGEVWEKTNGCLSVTKNDLKIDRERRLKKGLWKKNKRDYKKAKSVEKRANDQRYISQFVKAAEAEYRKKNEGEKVSWDEIEEIRMDARKEAELYIEERDRRTQLAKKDAEAAEEKKRTSSRFYKRHGGSGYKTRHGSTIYDPKLIAKVKYEEQKEEMMGKDIDIKKMKGTQLCQHSKEGSMANTQGYYVSADLINKHNAKRVELDQQRERERLRPLFSPDPKRSSASSN